MEELGPTQDQLADRMDTALADITGRPGDVSARTVRNLLNGASRRPIGRTCAALERVFGCPVEDLGFSAPRTMQHPQEDPVRRRTFIGHLSTYAVSEVMVRPGWRKQGISERLHEALLKERTEDLAVLLVDVTHPKVQALYESWGYAKAGEQQPFADSPVYAVMVKELRT